MKGKIYYNMSVDASNYYLDYLDEPIDDRDTTCLHLIVKKSIDTKYLDFFEEIKSNNRLPKLGVARKWLLSIKPFLAKGAFKVDHKKYLLLIHIYQLKNVAGLIRLTQLL